MDASKTKGNLVLWNRLETTDPNFTKRFDTGSFKGTAVDAVYNLKRVTEQLGPVGFAWGWHIVKDELRQFGEASDKSQTWIHNLVVRAWFKQEDGSVREIEHVGSTIAARWVGKQGSKYFMTDADYAKKSVTDALSRVMMSLGASADIWLGRFDGNKYASQDEEPAARAGGTPPEPAQDPQLVVEAQSQLIGIGNADEDKLREIRDWLASSADGKGASRWIRLGVQSPALRERLATAMNTRAQELGVALKGGSAA